MTYSVKAESEPLILDPKNESHHQSNLGESYINTSFWVETAEYSIRLRVGEHNLQLDDLLARFSAEAWAYITAFNPGSRRLSADENQRRQRQLCATVDELGYATLRGQGIGDVGEWPAEESILIIGIGEPMARTLGQRFGQNAILIGRRGAAPALLWC